MGGGGWAPSQAKGASLPLPHRGGASDRAAPFGGYKMSGNGREWGDYAFQEFLEVKAVPGWAPQAAE